jgi:repressor LexA
MDIECVYPYSKLRQRSSDLTPERVEVLKHLATFQEHHSYPPSVRELAGLLSLRSPSTVHAHLESLERQGLVCRQTRSIRSWRPTRGGLRLLREGPSAA